MNTITKNKILAVSLLLSLFLLAQHIFAQVLPPTTPTPGPYNGYKWDSVRGTYYKLDDNGDEVAPAPKTASPSSGNSDLGGCEYANSFSDIKADCGNTPPPFSKEDETPAPDTKDKNNKTDKQIVTPASKPPIEDGYVQAEIDSGYLNQSLSLNDKIATEIGATKVSVTQDISKEIPGVYPMGAIPVLNDGEVLVKGRSTALTVDGTDTRIDNKVNDTYYVVNKDKLPEGYVIGYPEQVIQVAGKNIPIYDLANKADVLAVDLQHDRDGEFKYDVKNPANRSLNTLAARLVNSVMITVSGNDSITGHIASNLYNEKANVTLAKFANPNTYTIPNGATQEQKENVVYDTVNNNIKSTIRGLASTLEDDVANRSGICRDKTPALVVGLNAVGIKAAQVVSDGHTFAAVLNTDGSVNHYLDPMFYETYLPLQRPSVSTNQIIPNKSFKK